MLDNLKEVYSVKFEMLVNKLKSDFTTRYMSEVQKIPKIHFGSKSNQTHHSKNPKRSQISRF